MEDRALGDPKGDRPVSAVDEYVGRQLRRNRVGRGLSPLSVAESLGVDVLLLTRWETGWERIPPAYLLKLSQVLSCSLASFFDGLQEALQIPGDAGGFDGDLTNLLNRYSAPKH